MSDEPGQCEEREVSIALGKQMTRSFVSVILVLRISNLRVGKQDGIEEVKVLVWLTA